MFKALMVAMKYKALLPRAIEFIVFVQNATRDGKLDKAERGKVLSYMWDIIKEAERLNARKVGGENRTPTVNTGKQSSRH